MNLPFFLGTDAGHETGGGDGAWIDHGIGEPAWHRFKCGERIEGTAGGVGAELGTGLARTDELADQRELKGFDSS